MHILFDANSLVHQKTGVGYFSERLLSALGSRDDIKITAYYFNFLGRKRHVELPQSPNIQYKVIRFFPSKLLSLMRRFGIQPPIEMLVGLTRYNFALYPNFVSLPSLRKLPFAVAIHDMCFLDYPQYLQDQNRRFLERFTKKSAQRSSLIITISEFTQSRIEKHFGKNTADKAIVLPIPYESSEDSGKIRASVKQLTNKPYLLYVGTIEPRKNIEGLVNGYRLLPAKLRGESTLVLAGGVGWQAEEVMAEIKSAKQTANISQLGYVSSAERSFLYRNAAGVCLLSHYEGFGMPILEAFHYKKPLLLSSIPVFHEVAGDHALYCDQTSPQDITAKIQKILCGDVTKQPFVTPKGYNWNTNAKRLAERIEVVIQGGVS